MRLPARDIDRQRLKASTALKRYQHTQAYAAALALASRLLSYTGSGGYTEHDEAARLIANVAGIRSPRDVLLRLTQFSMALLDYETHGDELDIATRDARLAMTFIGLGPKKVRLYVRQRPRAIIAQMLLETVVPFTWALAGKVAADESERQANVKLALSVMNERPEHQGISNE